MDVDLCNAALRLLGLDPMADPEHPRGRVESAIAYACDDARREILQAEFWTACDKCATIGPADSETAPPGFSYIGLLPDDFLGLWRADQEQFAVMAAGDGEAMRRRIAWCGDAALVIRYSALIPYALMDPLLRHAAAARLAIPGSIAQSEKANDRKIHSDLAVLAEMKAAARDALNRQETPLFTSRWDPANISADRRGNW